MNLDMLPERERLFMEEIVRCFPYVKDITPVDDLPVDVPVSLQPALFEENQ